MMNGHQARSDLVDRALEGKSPETKARVLDLTYRLHLEPTDELFLFCIAIGYLETIVIDAPEQWEAVFANFRNNLEQWKNHHQRTLETSEQLAEQIGRMTRNLTTQTDYMSDLARGLQIMMRQSESTKKDSPDLAQMLKILTKRLDEREEEQNTLIRREMRNVSETVYTLERLLKTQPSAPNTNSGYTKATDTPNHQNQATSRLSTSSVSNNQNPAVSIMLVIVVMLVGLNCTLIFHQRQVINWLLIKANRAECRIGIVEKTSQQCALFQ